jgi:hypothetical protein
LDKGAFASEVQYLYGRLVCICDRYKQESAVSYPVKSVITYNKYPTKEGNDALAVSRREDAKDTDGSRGRSRL